MSYRSRTFILPRVKLYRANLYEPLIRPSYLGAPPRESFSVTVEWDNLPADIKATIPRPLPKTANERGDLWPPLVWVTSNYRPTMVPVMDEGSPQDVHRDARDYCLIPDALFRGAVVDLVAHIYEVRSERREVIDGPRLGLTGVKFATSELRRVLKDLVAEAESLFEAGA